MLQTAETKGLLDGLSRAQASNRAFSSSRLRRYGMLRMVRDVFHISTFLLTDAFGQIVQVVLN